MLYYYLARNENCTIKDHRVLMYDFTLPELLELKEVVDMSTALEMAREKDDKVEEEMQRLNQR